MSTNAIGPGTVNVTVNMPDSLKTQLKKAAKESGMSLNAFANALLQDCVTTGAVVEKPKVVRRSKKKPQ
jgi:hypothetical protein